MCRIKENKNFDDSNLNKIVIDQSKIEMIEELNNIINEKNFNVNNYLKNNYEDFELNIDDCLINNYNSFLDNEYYFF